MLESSIYIRLSDWSGSLNLIVMFGLSAPDYFRVSIVYPSFSPLLAWRSLKIGPAFILNTKQLFSLTCSLNLSFRFWPITAGVIRDFVLLLVLRLVELMTLAVLRLLETSCLASCFEALWADLSFVMGLMSLVTSWPIPLNVGSSEPLRRLATVSLSQQISEVRFFKASFTLASAVRYCSVQVALTC